MAKTTVVNGQMNKIAIANGNDVMPTSSSVVTADVFDRRTDAIETTIVATCQTKLVVPILVLARVDLINFNV